jgi:hypothetical protein
MLTAAIISLVLSVAATTYQAVNQYQNAKIQEKQAEANAQQAEYEAQMERNAEAMNATRTRRDARARIAAAKAKYAAEGNIGESADATIEDAYVNLASDLSALHFNSENRAIQSENESLMYNFNSKVARLNKTSAVIGGSLNTAAAVASSISGGYASGAFGGGSTPKVTGYTGAVSNNGMYGAWAGK